MGQEGLEPSTCRLTVDNRTSSAQKLGKEVKYGVPLSQLSYWPF
jgi:hypothetical protein